LHRAPLIGKGFNASRRQLLLARRWRSRWVQRMNAEVNRALASAAGITVEG
jgi:hypothetical protein